VDEFERLLSKLCLSNWPGALTLISASAAKTGLSSCRCLSYIAERSLFKDQVVNCEVRIGSPGADCVAQEGRSRRHVDPALERLVSGVKLSVAVAGGVQ